MKENGKMKKLLLVISMLFLVSSCGKKSKNNSGGSDHVFGISAQEIRKAYYVCSIRSYNQACTDYRSNRKLYMANFYDNRCFNNYVHCLDRRGVKY